jgi:hypothetical protein
MGKKSILIFADKSEQVDLLTDEQAGRLFKSLLSYAIDGITLQTEDKLVKMVYISIRNDIDRNTEKYERRCQVNRNNGQKGGRPKKPNGLQEKPNESDGLQGKPNKTLKDKDKDNDIIFKDNKKEIQKKDELSLSHSSENEEYSKFVDWYKENAPYCSKNITVCTEKEFMKLLSSYSKKLIADTVLNIENRTDLRKKYSSLYRTLINWLKKENNGKQ